MDERAPALRVLLAEDDPVSARFLAEALRLLGAAVDVHADGPAALDAATLLRFDLLLLDLGLPRLDGSAVLRALRAHHGAASRSSRAIATSAGAVEPEALRAAGFEGLLRKPASLDDLASVLGRGSASVAEPRPVGGAPVLDDAAALRALGDVGAVADLRRLLAAELPAQLAALRSCVEAKDTEGARGVLHRLHASTRFCGAVALATAGTRMQQALAGARADADVAPALDALAAAAAEYAARVSR